MSLPKRPNSQDCSTHNYCPHLHYQKCRKNRENKIFFSKQPTKEVDLTCNVHPKELGCLTTRNIPTLAFERYKHNPILPDQEDTSFSKNFYLQNCPDKFQIRNTLLKDLEEELVPGNAYNLASGATAQYNKFAKQRQDHLFNARKRADEAYLQFMHGKRLESQKLKAEQNKWITDYYRRIEELINHIYKKGNKQNQDPNIKDKQFIKEQQGKSLKVKVTNPKVALGILETLRAHLLKKKVNLDEQRRDQEHNKSVSASCLDASEASNASQNMSAVSFLSATTVGDKQAGEEHFAEKFCDFEKLKKKWGKDNVEQVRNTLRMMLCRNLVNKAERTEMRERKKAREKNEFLKKQLMKMGKLKGNDSGKDSKKKKKKELSHEDEKPEQKTVVFFKDSLSKEEQFVKTTLQRGGRFDSVGNIYERNRNYSSLFTKRGDESFRDFSLRDSRQTSRC